MLVKKHKHRLFTRKLKMRIVLIVLLIVIEFIAVIWGFLIGMFIMRLL